MRSVGVCGPVFGGRCALHGVHGRDRPRLLAGNPQTFVEPVKAIHEELVRHPRKRGREVVVAKRVVVVVEVDLLGRDPLQELPVEQTRAAGLGVEEWAKAKKEAEAKAEPEQIPEADYEVVEEED